VRWKMLTAQLCGGSFWPYFGSVCSPPSFSSQTAERMSDQHDLEDDFVR